MSGLGAPAARTDPAPNVAAVMMPAEFFSSVRRVYRLRWSGCMPHRFYKELRRRSNLAPLPGAAVLWHGCTSFDYSRLTFARTRLNDVADRTRKSLSFSCSVQTRGSHERGIAATMSQFTCRTSKGAAQ